MKTYRFDRNIDLLKPSSSDRGPLGQRSSVYARIRVRATLVREQGTETVGEAIEATTQNKRVVVRWMRNLTPAWKARIGSTYYDLAAVDDIPGTRRRSYMQLTLERSRKPYEILSDETELFTEEGQTLITEHGDPLLI